MKKVLIICILLASAGCRVDNSPSDLSPSPSPSPRPPTLTGLRSFEDCQQLQQYLQSLNDLGSATPVDDMDPLADSSPANAADTAPEVSVEEGDIARQVGNRLYIANRLAGLIIYDTSVPAFPKQVGHIPLDHITLELQVDGTRVALISAEYDPQINQHRTTVRLFDASDASDLQLISEKAYEGLYTGSRLVGHVLYLALGSPLRSDELDNAQTRFASCEDVYVPVQLEAAQASPNNVWTLIGLEMQGAAHRDTQIDILASWYSHILASPEHFYLTSYLYAGDETDIHLFRISPQQASIQPWSQAEVPGAIVNERAIDETDGVLRVASTTDRWSFGEQRNYVTTLDVSNSQLEPLGQVDTITPGERITAARFTTDYAFLTTFVTVDPLVIVDLRHPTQPAVLGELEVPGIAHQLEVWGDRLIAIGQSDPFCGRVTLSLFDISDLHNPQLIDQLEIANSIASSAFWDHQAYTFHPQFQLLALPIKSSGHADSMGFFHVDPDSGFTELGNLDHSQLLDDEERVVFMERSLRVVNHHYTISEAGISVSNFFDLTEPVSEIAFPDLDPEDFFPVSEVAYVDMCVMP